MIIPWFRNNLCTCCPRLDLPEPGICCSVYAANTRFHLHKQDTYKYMQIFVTGSAQQENTFSSRQTYDYSSRMRQMTPTYHLGLKEICKQKHRHTNTSCAFFTYVLTQIQEVWTNIQRYIYMIFLEKWSKQPPEKVAKNHLINIIKLWEIWCFSGMC